MRPHARARARAGAGSTAASPRVGPWFVYLLRCGDGSLYCGITNDLARRVEAHRRGKGARYTRSRPPVRLAYWESSGSRSAALRREHALKKLPRARKLELVAGGGAAAGGSGSAGRREVGTGMRSKRRAARGTEREAGGGATSSSPACRSRGPCPGPASGARPGRASSSPRSR
ncbi:MAG: GIY-YIG nuclease family protein [Planctomycetes bacterium]|nr:GIY-YIG nuclease family protein [Planctomycetota bacterium]